MNEDRQRGHGRDAGGGARRCRSGVGSDVVESSIVCARGGKRVKASPAPTWRPGLCQIANHLVANLDPTY